MECNLSWPILSKQAQPKLEKLGGLVGVAV
jgi:hypothetical protein